MKSVELGVRVEGKVESSEFVHERLLEHLQQLLATGLYGRTLADVVARLVERGALRELGMPDLRDHAGRQP